MNVKLDRAKRLLDAGYSIIPVKSNKLPSIKWKEYQNNQITKEKLDELQHKVEISGYGFCTGFDNLEVIDVDLKILPTLKEQKDFWDEFIGLLNDNVPELMSKVCIYKTINNGYHIIYKANNIEGNKKLAKLEGYTEAIIETRGIGGYAFIYDNKVGELDYTEVTEISELDRDTIIGCCKYYDFKTDEIKYETKVKDKQYHTDNPSWVEYNERNSALDVVQDDFTIVSELSDKYIIKRHGAKSDHSGYIYKDSFCMYLFSTGTVYPAEELLSPFACYTYKYHNGDFSEAAKDIYRQGYGDRIEIQIDKIELKYDKENLDFPIEIFPENIQRYIYGCYETLDSSIDYMGCAFVWVISLIIGNTINLEVKKGWKSNATVWIALIGKAGVGKTPSISNITFPLDKQNTHEIKHYQKQFEKYLEYKSKDKDGQDYVEEVHKPRQTQFIANDVTIEALVQMHEENKHSVGVFKDELAGWLKDMNKYRAGSDLEFWLSCWSGKSVTLNRKTTKNSFVEKPMIPVLGGIQPEILDQFSNGENKENGFIDRILCSYPELDIEKYNDNEMPSDLIEWYESFIINLYKLVQREFLQFNQDDEVEPHIAIFTDDAKEEWKRIFNKITDMQNSDSENQYMKSMLPKQKTYIPRFALILNFIASMDGSNALEVSKESILNAEKLSDYFINMAKKIKVHSSERIDAKEILDRNKLKPKEDVAKLIHKHHPEMSKTELAELMNVSRQMVYKYLK